MTPRPEQPEGQDHTGQTDDAVQPGVSQSQGSAPWENDLASRFEDENVRQSVDEFLRTSVQPYVTQLEQDRNPDADRLYAELNERPGDTFLAITEELFGPEAAQRVQNTLLSSFDDVDDDDDEDDEGDDDAAGVDTSGQQNSLDPRVERVVSAYEQEQQRAAYNAELATVKAQAEREGVKVVDELIAPFVVASDGDLRTAYQGYKKFVGEWQQAFGQTPDAADQVTAAAAAESQEQQPPPVLGSDSTGSTTPPTQRKYTSIDDALDDFFDEQKSPAPPAVGTT